MAGYYACKFCHGRGCLACPGEQRKAEEKEVEWHLNKKPLSESGARFVGLVLDAVNEQNHGCDPVSFTKPNQPRYENGRYRDCPKCRGVGCVSCPEEADAEFKRQFPDGPQPIAIIKIDPSDPDAVKNALRDFLEDRERVQ